VLLVEKSDWTSPDAAFANPSKECDIIMKGGITSGVVYPRAVAELAQTYRLRNVGGTSAGAIAAALAAAAERGRDAGGFEKLAELPDFLATNLTSLFQPAKAARPAFEILLAWIAPGGRLKKMLATLGKLIRFHALAFLIGALLGLFFFWLAADFPSQGQLIRSRAIPLGMLSLLTWGLIVVLIAFVRSSVLGIRKNAFGMCSGMPPDGKARRPALTPWMADRLDEMSGLSGRAGGAPLTFGDLWGSSPAGDPEEDPRLRAINLEVMSTDLTLGWPVRFPTSSRELFFHPAELRGFFPERVVQWLLDHPFPPRDEQEKIFIDRIVADTPYHPLPAPADLPVVVAARMSLSFPVLISAVPLYAVDWSLKSNQEARAAGRAPALGRCWFSDGGICSNFPIHFFDGLLPERPTFGINLRSFHPDYPKDEHDESKNVWFPTQSRQAVLPTWNPIEGLVGFLGSIIRTMQNWQDHTQMRLPGYRDRIVHVFLTGEEGGLNLTMPKDRVEALTRRGAAAGQAVQKLDWDGHRWTRFRTALAQLQEKLDRVKEIYTGSYRQFLVAHDSAKGRYQRPKAWKDYALKSTDDLMAVVGDWDQDPHGYRLDNKPLPSPGADLRMGPKL
jgi:predicted acylesterase/phospholipase RssA